MKLKFLILILLGTSVAFAAKSPEPLPKSLPASLVAVEKKYQSANTIQMDVLKKLRIPLLEKEKLSEGTIKIMKGGKFKWEVTKPDHSMVLLTPAAVWAVDYPREEGEKVSVIKSRKPKKNQSPAIVTFLMGQGSLSKSFKILSAVKAGGDTDKIELEAKSKNEAVKNMTVIVNRKEVIIEKINFEDSVGNLTELEFSNVKFDEKFEKTEFKLSLPKNADVNIVD